jgi:predicted DsbA family dithiol-disulfide isomerase
MPETASTRNEAVMDAVRFHFDPICPWCYQTSRWAKRIEALGEIDLDWGLFSLEVVNLKEGDDPHELQARSGPALRTATLIRQRKGGGAIGPFYTALGKRIWEQSPPEQDMATAVRGALEEVGLDVEWCDEALADPGTWEAVLDEHHGLIERTRSFGVPTIVLDGGTGPVVFRPVIRELPSDEEAVDLVATRFVAGPLRQLRRAQARPYQVPGSARHDRYLAQREADRST